VLVAVGMLPSLMSTTISMSNSEEGIDDMSTMMKDNNASNNNNNMAMSDSSSKASTDISDDSVGSIPTNDDSDQIASDHNGQSEEFKDNNNSNGQTKMMGME
jgi:hypothetical protein